MAGFFLGAKMVFGFGKLFGGKKNETQAAPAPAAQPAASPVASIASLQEEIRTAFVRRDAIFNKERRIAGHLYRLQLTDAGLGDLPSERQKAHDDLLLKSLSLSKDELAWGSQIGFIPLATISLDNPWLERLPVENTVILLTLSPETTDGDALTTRLEKLRQALMELRVPCEDGDLPAITVSIGVAAAESVEINAAALLNRADVALYQAKARGRNCIVNSEGVDQ